MANFEQYEEEVLLRSGFTQDMLDDQRKHALQKQQNNMCPICGREAIFECDCDINERGCGHHSWYIKDGQAVIITPQNDPHNQHNPHDPHDPHDPQVQPNTPQQTTSLVCPTCGQPTYKITQYAGGSLMGDDFGYICKLNHKTPTKVLFPQSSVRLYTS